MNQHQVTYTTTDVINKLEFEVLRLKILLAGFIDLATSEVWDDPAKRAEEVARLKEAFYKIPNNFPETLFAEGAVIWQSGHNDVPLLRTDET